GEYRRRFAAHASLRSGSLTGQRWPQADARLPASQSSWERLGGGSVHISIIGVPIDLGANRRGVDMVPSAMRYAGLHRALAGLGPSVSDLGDVVVPGPAASDPGAPPAQSPRHHADGWRE